MSSIVKRVFFLVIIIYMFSNIAVGLSYTQEERPIETMTPDIYNEEDPIQIRQSASWVLIGTTILVDNNWKEIRDTYDWCNGEGTKIDPYIIENITIDAQGSESCIQIQNCDDHFIIQNCILTNSGPVYPPNAGISLNNVSNGKLIDNYCYNNNHGILLWECENNSISGNTVSNNNINGILIVLSNNNTIENNVASNNDDQGISLSWSNGNTVTDNNAYYNGRGIALVTNCSNNRILNNTVNDNLNGIILEFFVINNEVSRNAVKNNDGFGLALFDYCHNNTITENNIDYSLVGIYMGLSENNTVLGNVMHLCGIVIHGRLNELGTHTIDKTNIVNNKLVYYYVNEIGLSSINFTNAGQIILVNCNNSLISTLNLSYCSIGIYLGYSHNITVLENTVNNNAFGINLFFSDKNILSDNTVNYNDAGYQWPSNIGIILDESNHNMVSGNILNNNGFCGLASFHCNNSIVSGNNLLNNNYYGMWLASSHNNKISDNIVDGNNYYGIMCSGINFTISGNVVKNNDYGIYIYDSKDSRIFLNIFTNNGQNAIDDGGTDNKWDNGRIGNYWDDYQGIDLNLDGIGDIPYSIPGTSGSQDNFPRGTNMFQPLGIYILSIVIIVIICVSFFRYFSKKKGLKNRNIQ